MKQILLINGHQWYPNSQGRLNQTIFETIRKQLEQSYHVTTTIVDQGYDVEEERQKYLSADIIIYQTPIYWFSLPGKFKSYFDQVLKRGVLYTKGERYGRGGLLTGKKYMISTTWSAPLEEFGSKDGFFRGREVDDVLFPIHCTHAFMDMEQLETFSVHNIFKDLQVEKYVEDVQKHLQHVLENE
ncbi:Modulator of drug activity B [Paraliobacillus sp. PM-2]|uniref:NAD(P)H-dependent oxidoreductase n=1 Tax=Paraliobacillus sp. PM-2 TaxID=1462524 RepID=UPI00061B939A|nr:NAD(P)H-dependent oxidoreductase [Paraliobacillus sp. PM-2]CQR45983.1 Modulator of drug activity B [Paraliobacillus sp. PM-2]